MSDALERAKAKRAMGLRTTDATAFFATLSDEELTAWCLDTSDSTFVKVLATRLTAANARIAELEAEHDATCVWTKTVHEAAIEPTYSRALRKSYGGRAERASYKQACNGREPIRYGGIPTFCPDCGHPVTVAEGETDGAR